MLTTQLKSIQKYLLSLESNNKSLNRDQKKLLHELNFLDKSSIVEIALSDYSYSEMKTESFAVASSACPKCGKKY